MSARLLVWAVAKRMASTKPIPLQVTVPGFAPTQHDTAGGFLVCGLGRLVAGSQRPRRAAARGGLRAFVGYLGGTETAYGWGHSR